MGPDEQHIVEWRDAETYAPLLEADRSIFAWEWLRRDPGYRAAACAAFERAEATEAMRPEPWGLHAFENPDLAAPNARPVWRVDVHPYVLTAVAAGPDGSPDAFDLASFRPLVTIVRAATGHEHLLLSDGLRAIRIDVLAGSLAKGPVQLRYLLTGLASAERPLLTLRRLLALCRTGRFSAALHPVEAKARRLVLMLRANDALASGARQREIAAELLSVEAREARWRVGAPTLRSRVQRLVRSARMMAVGGYTTLLKA